MPVLDFKNDLVATLAAVGLARNIDFSGDGKTVRELRRASEKFVNLMG